MIIMENDKQEISVLVNELCGKKSRKRCNEIFALFNNDLMYIDKHYIESEVDEKALLRLLQKSKSSNKIKFFLPDIIFLVNKNSITDKFVDCCIKYPGKYRNTLITQLAHIWLMPNQLELLNTVLSTPEAFCKLLIIYTFDSCYSAIDLMSLLTNNKSYLADAKYCITRALQNSSKEINEEKILVLKSFNLL